MKPEKGKQSLIQGIDARTLLIIALCSGLSSMFARSMEKHAAFMCLMTVILILFHRWRQALLFLLVYVLAAGGLFLEMIYGIISFPSPLLLSLIYKLIPVSMSLYLLAQIPSGKLTAGLRKLPILSGMRLILLVMLRFAPTVLLEFAEIKNAMRVRGLLGSLRQIVRHPMDTLEYAMVPMVFRSLKISDELSASAVVRGIEYPGKKESYYVSRIGGIDIIFSAGIIISCIFCCL